MAVDDAKTIKELSDEALALYNQSLLAYHQLNLRAWERATGARKIDNDEVMKDLTTFWGTVARDLGNLQMVWQQAARVANPTATAGEGEQADDQ